MPSLFAKLLPKPVLRTGLTAVVSLSGAQLQLCSFSLVTEGSLPALHACCRLTGSKQCVHDLRQHSAGPQLGCPTWLSSWCAPWRTARGASRSVRAGNKVLQ